MNRAGTERKERGFTLIEVIAAVSIISIGMLALVPLLISSYKVDKQTSYRVRAQYAMAQQMDTLISPDSPTAGGGTDFIDAQTGLVYGSAPSVPVVITRTWTVGNAPDNQHPISQVTVTVTYTDQGGTKTLTSFAQKGN